MAAAGPPHLVQQLQVGIEAHAAAARAEALLQRQRQRHGEAHGRHHCVQVLAAGLQLACSRGSQRGWCGELQSPAAGAICAWARSKGSSAAGAQRCSRAPVRCCTSCCSERLSTSRLPSCSRADATQAPSCCSSAAVSAATGAPALGVPPALLRLLLACLGLAPPSVSAACRTLLSLGDRGRPRGLLLPGRGECEGSPAAECWAAATLSRPASCCCTAASWPLAAASSCALASRAAAASPACLCSAATSLSDPDCWVASACCHLQCGHPGAAGAQRRAPACVYDLPDRAAQAAAFSVGTQELRSPMPRVPTCCWPAAAPLQRRGWRGPSAPPRRPSARACGCAAPPAARSAPPPPAAAAGCWPRGPPAASPAAPPAQLSDSQAPTKAARAAQPGPASSTGTATLAAAGSAPVAPA
jgi:hypothetical protein